MPLSVTIITIKEFCASLLQARKPGSHYEYGGRPRVYCGPRRAATDVNADRGIDPWRYHQWQNALGRPLLSSTDYIDIGSGFVDVLLKAMPIA